MFEFLDGLDMMLRMSIDPGVKISQFTKRFDISSHASILFGRSSTEVTLYFQDSPNIGREMKILLQEFDSKNVNGIWRVRIPVIKSVKFASAVRNILSLPSTINASFFQSAGVFYIDFLFHHSDLDRISSIILKEISVIKEADVLYLGPAMPFEKFLLDINSRTPLSVVKLKIKPPEYEIDPDRNPMGMHWKRILKIPFGSDEIDGVYFMDTEPAKSEKIVEISRNKIYKAVTGNPFLIDLTREFNERRISSIARVQFFDSPFMEEISVIPSMFNDEFLGVLHSVSSKMKGWDITLESLIPLESAIG